MKVRTRAVWLLAIVAVLSTPTGLIAQENPSPEQLKKMYDEAVAQLKAAQERKNQLATENEKLGQQITGLKNELNATSAKLEELKKADAEHAEKTFYLRAHYVAWQQYIRQSPELEARWRAYLLNDYLAAARDPWELIDRKWPLGSLAIVAAAQPASRPTTRPLTTQPATTQPATLPSSTQPTTLPSTLPAATQPTATQPATLPTTVPTTQPKLRAM